VALRLTHECRRKISKKKKMGQSLCAPLQPFRSEFNEKFYHFILHNILMCTRIKIFRYTFHGATKTVKFIKWYKKRTAVPPFVLTEMLLSHAIFFKLLEASYLLWICNTLNTFKKHLTTHLFTSNLCHLTELSPSASEALHYGAI